MRSCRPLRDAACPSSIRIVGSIGGQRAAQTRQQQPLLALVRGTAEPMEQVVAVDQQQVDPR